MKKAYVKPQLNVSMNGTLEGVYACYGYENKQNPEPTSCNYSNQNCNTNKQNHYNGCCKPWWWWCIFG